MKQKKLFIPFIVTIALIAICCISLKSSSYSKDEYENLLLENVEALAWNDTNPNEMYGYEMTSCYGKKKLGDREYDYKTGEKCEPINSRGICNRKMQWGTCQ